MKTATFFERLERHTSAPRAPALIGQEREWSYSDLLNAADTQAQLLRDAGTNVLATLLDNSPEWIVADLAALRANVVHVPLPAFFTAAQTAGVLAATGADAMISLAAAAPRLQTLGFQHAQDLDAGLALYTRASAAVAMPAGTAKITFTSGSTGEPKGVCLDAAGMFSVAQALTLATANLGIDRHLNALPFPVLLENIAGVYAPLLNGATCVTLPLQQVGLSGSSSFDPRALHHALTTHHANSVITLPQMLRAYVHALHAQTLPAPGSLSFVAVGGGAVGQVLLMQAQALGLPAFEGYGLSEGASVQTLNLPGVSRYGSVGKPLPHARVRIAADGEIEVAGSLFLGYLGSPPAPGEWLATGDLGEFDDDGFLHILGRKKNLLITAFGRNVSPEWVETELRSDPRILQAVVLGEAQPALGAVLWPTSVDVTPADLQAAVEGVNSRLPDYARIGSWISAKAPFSSESGLATINGRPRREAIAALHDTLFPVPADRVEPAVPRIS